MRKLSLVMRSSAFVAQMLLVLAVCGMSATASNEGLATENGADTTAAQQVPVLKQAKTIDLSYVGRESGLTSIMLGWNRKTFDFHVMSFSPDSRYLAIAGGPIPTMTDIVIWDLQKNQQQSHIHFSPMAYVPERGGTPVWRRDGKIIWFGKKQQWDAMSGEALPDTPTEEGIKRPNRDGTKIMIVTNFSMAEPSALKIYDPDNWTLIKDIYLDGYGVKSLAWTAEEKILVGISNTKETFGKVVNGRMNERRPDVALKLIDPFGSEPAKVIWFPAIPDEKRSGDWVQPMRIKFLAANVATNSLSISDAKFLDAETLDIRGFSFKENENYDVGPHPFATEQAFSADGKFLFVKRGKRFDSNKPAVNFIVDVAAGKVISNFLGGDAGIAVSPDGKWLAYGDGHETIQILSIESK